MRGQDLPFSLTSFQFFTDFYTLWIEAGRSPRYTGPTTHTENVRCPLSLARAQAVLGKMLHCPHGLWLACWPGRMRSVFSAHIQLSSNHLKQRSFVGEAVAPQVPSSSLRLSVLCLEP